MHKRAPLLRPRKNPPSGKLSTSSTFKQQPGTIRKKESKKVPYALIMILSIIFGACLYMDKSKSAESFKNTSSTAASSSTATNIQEANEKKFHISPQEVPPGESKPKTSVTSSAQEDEASDYNPNYHLIFSTDCSAFQHWQSYLMFHSAYKVGQPGTITRIASGCSDADGEKEMKWHTENISNVMGDRFKLHLTPHFSGVKDADGNVVGDYKFFNKPFGLLHWLENAMGFKAGSTTELNNPDDVVILIDPDMILLRPITGDFSNPRDIVVGKHHEREQKFFVKHGAPFAQKYGLGAQWRKFDLDAIAGADSPAKEVSQNDAVTFYPVGPPYIATVGDMYQIALKWTEFVPRVHKQYPYLLAEMYAFCIAAAHLGLKHQLLDSLMISNVGVGGEGWPMIDNITNEKVSSLCDYAAQPDHSKFPVPSVIHYCQRYAIGDWFFGKRKMVKDFFECDSPLMAFPPSDIIETSNFKHIFNDKRKELTEANARREGFMTCGALGALNDAGTFFKENSCKDTTPNMEKKTNLNKR